MKNLLISICFFILTQPKSGNISDLECIPILKGSIPEFKNWMSYKVYKEDNTLKYRPSDLSHEEVSDFGFDLPPRTLKNMKYITKPTCSYKVDNGWIIGFNKGEFGGALFWFSKSGSKYYMIKKGNVHNIIKLNNKIYITQGLAHLGSSFGSSISEIVFKENKWSINKTKELKGCPFQSTLFKDKILIITTNNILLADSDLNLMKKMENGFWSTFYPNSIVIENNTAYFGMRRGILKMNLKNEKKYWLTEIEN